MEFNTNVSLEITLTTPIIINRPYFDAWSRANLEVDVALTSMVCRYLSQA